MPYAWPGNVSELEIVIERAAILAPDGAEVSADLIFVVPPEKRRSTINLLRDEGVRAILCHPRVVAVATWVNMAFVGWSCCVTLSGALAPGHPLAAPTPTPACC